MRAANQELLKQRDEEYQARVYQEKQQEKSRSIALLKKKEHELQLKDQQLRAVRQRVQELERAAGVQPASTGGKPSLEPPASGQRRHDPAADGCLPPLSAR
ncbi:unnamed protein product [Prorocentrum cordatum]|uniref:Uncharacterized protein n=1 Tax=Prorocentrum cordatum TaxID=2364126 RepID=A0ABN9UKB0_9DINO|nr:unnamed protein product [Polarella glacialis]